METRKILDTFAKPGCMFLTLLSVALSARTSFAAPNGTATADGYEITVAAGDADVTLNSDDVTELGASTTLIKKGKGRLIIDTDLAAAGILSSSGTLSIPAGCVLTVEDPEALTGRKYQLANAASLVGPVPMLEGLSTEWTVRKNGNSLWLVNPRGFVMVVK